MLARFRRFPVAVLALALTTAGAAAAVVAVHAHSAHAAARPPIKQACARSPTSSVYRFDFTVASDKAGEAATTDSYSLSLQERRAGSIVAGENVPLQSGAPASPRQDVGLKIKCAYSTIGTPGGSKILLHDDVELSSFVDAPAIGKIVADGDAVLTPGQPTQVASVEEPGTHRKYRVVVTATRVL